MRVLIINTSERTGGAAIAASRLLEALKNNGIKAKMLVRDKQTDHINVVTLKKSLWRFWQFVWERIVIWSANHFSRRHLFDVDIANTGTDITHLPEFTQADVVHLHWINQGMLSMKDLQRILDSGKPIVWTLHDMWPFTGICHYSEDCDRYLTHCQSCPLLAVSHPRDLAYHVYEQKRKLYASEDPLSKVTDERLERGSIRLGASAFRHRIHFVACSHWLEGLAKQSPLLKGHEVLSIPNAINTNLFRPRDKQTARQKLGLPADKTLLLFGSMKITDPRKGINYLIEACRLLKEQHPEFCERLGVVVLGKQSEACTSLFPFPIYPLAYMSSEKQLPDVYNAVDLYVTPSIQDNLPNTIVEAMACGIPCVGFNVGGIPQMIDHLHNGYVAEYKSAADLANGIHWTLTEGDPRELSEEAFRKALNSYSESTIARKYIDIYNKITTCGHA
jgi:glycosyltransferase involved in cell wall biosynthesis